MTVLRCMMNAGPLSGLMATGWGLLMETLVTLGNMRDNSPQSTLGVYPPHTTQGAPRSSVADCERMGKLRSHDGEGGSSV